jgi:hypothetical protein
MGSGRGPGNHRVRRGSAQRQRHPLPIPELAPVTSAF